MGLRSKISSAISDTIFCRDWIWHYLKKKMFGTIWKKKYGATGWNLGRISDASLGRNPGGISDGGVPNWTPGESMMKLPLQDFMKKFLLDEF